MVMKPGQVQLLSVLKACQSSVGSNISNLTRMAAPTTLVGPPELKQPVTSSPPPPQLQLLYQLASVSSATKDNYRSFGNPCHAIYFNYKTHRHLKQLLPLAWSHNPLTTLKLICSLLCFEEKELFYTAASWLFQNHPKTLACNVVPIAGALGDFEDILEVLYGILDVNAVRKRRSRSRSRNLWFDYEEDVIQKKVGSGADISSNTRKKMIDMARKAVEIMGVIWIINCYMSGFRIFTLNA
ncbi:uncharacterized protein LOC110752089 [Prunus avium]|uniref:Uncharacterized protein LOC110752089 n=1 Tax=Prunus avium TaxID=42229 RepID=A0A6P5RU26_PRUAV|nr:uncharacterized protein LOC110752089 [Prunus avium]